MSLTYVDFKHLGGGDYVLATLMLPPTGYSWPKSKTRSSPTAQWFPGR
jgi:hypothetical protein